MHHNQWDESFRILVETYATYPDTDSGKQSGIIVAEHYMETGETQRAEDILNAIAQDAGFDREVRIRLDLAMATLNKIKGNESIANMYLQNVSDLPVREGFEEITRARRDAAHFNK